MSFRVATGTNFLMFRRMLSGATQASSLASERLTSGKRILKPSDDPAAASIISGVRDGNARIKQFLRNLTTADRQWAQIETANRGMIDLMNRAKELAIQGNNGTLAESEREILAEEVAQISQELLSLSNTQIDGQYIFAGFRSDTVPFSLDAAHPNANPAAIYAGDSNTRRIEVSENQFIDIQLRVDDLLTGTGAVGETPAFQALADLEASLRNNIVDDDDPNSVGAALEQINSSVTDLINRVATVGAQTNRITQTRDRLEAQKNLNVDFISQLEDVDFAEATFEFQKANISLQAAVQSAGAILQSPSLMQFLG